MGMVKGVGCCLAGLGLPFSLSIRVMRVFGGYENDSVVFLGWGVHSMCISWRWSRLFKSVHRIRCISLSNHSLRSSHISNDFSSNHSPP